jgi:hypothetical protein
MKKEKETELVFFNVYGAQESISRHQYRQPICSLAGRYDNPIPIRCLAPIGFLKIPAQERRWRQLQYFAKNSLNNGTGMFKIKKVE